MFFSAKRFSSTTCSSTVLSKINHVFFAGAVAAFCILPVSESAFANIPTQIESHETAFDRELAPGEFVWMPERAARGPVHAYVDLGAQLVTVYRGGTRIAVSTISSGMPGYETPTGTFEILQKRVEHYSNLYDNAPMPYMQRLTWDGIAFHVGRLPGEAASHGCIRLPREFAEKFFELTELGVAVQIVGKAGYFNPALAARDNMAVPLTPKQQTAKLNREAAKRTAELNRAQLGAATALD